MQFPFQYLLVGNGRASKHWRYYLESLSIPLLFWDRSMPDSEFYERLKKATHVLLLISDSSIRDFFDLRLSGKDKIVTHFSGALEIPGTFGAHPLMTFGPHFYELSFYQKIPFVVTSQSDFSFYLPGITNPSFRISADQKSYYHAYCVMAGNFTNVLWSQFDQALQNIGLPQGINSAYLEKITENVIKHGAKSLTGPFVRKDMKTISANIQALKTKGDDFLEVYMAFARLLMPNTKDFE